MSDIIVLIFPEGKKEYNLVTELSVADLRSLDTIDIDNCLYSIDDIRLKVSHRNAQGEPLAFVRRIEVLLGPVDTEQFYWANPQGASQTKISLTKNNPHTTHSSFDEEDRENFSDDIELDEREKKLLALCEQDEAEGNGFKASDRRCAFEFYKDEPIRAPQIPGHPMYDPRLDMFHRDFDYDYHADWLEKVQKEEQKS